MNIAKKIINKFKDETGIGNIVLNVNKTEYNKNCLISYIKEPFERESNNSHQNEIQVIEIARIIGQCGYNVDVIDYRSTHVMFNKKYDALFEVCIKEEPVYKKALEEQAVRIIYLTGSESKFANGEEIKRIRNLFDRRGVELMPRRQAPLILKEIENYDETIMIGNEYNLNTYKDFKLPKTFLVPNTGYKFNFKFDRNKKKSDTFLFFGSAGCVHKGLDLLLEIFSERDFPCTLYVCGNYMNELDFYEEYKNELTQYTNIKAVGFVDIRSEKFEKICSECSFAILPSCSESRAGTIATCMSAGLIPICSRICGYEEDEVIILEDCRKETIRKTILEVAKWTMDDLEEGYIRSIKLVDEKYNMNEFCKQMEEALREVL